MKKLLFRPAEAAELLGVGRSKIYALLAAGELPKVLVGKSVRVPAAGLAKWVSERSGEAPATEEPEVPFGELE